MKYLTLLLFMFSLAFSKKAFSQISLEKMRGKMEQQNQLQKAGIKTVINSKTQAGLYLRDIKLQETQSGKWLKDQLELRDGIDTLREERVHNLKDGFTVKRLHQYYKGIKVEHGVVNTTSQNGTVSMMQMELYSIPAQFNTKPAISEQTALKKATDYIGADKYAWSDSVSTDPDYMKPKGELVIIQTYKMEGEVCLAYKFNIFSLQPFKREYVYVNASDGSIVLEDPIIKHSIETSEEAYKGPRESQSIKNADEWQGIPFTEPAIKNPTIPGKSFLNILTGNVSGTAATRYSGSQTIVTDNGSTVIGKPFRLRQTRNGQDIITLNYLGNPGNTAANFDLQAVDFVDNDNNWTDAEFNNATWDNAALDAQFNMQIVSDFWNNVIGRNSWDNQNGPIINNIHVTQNKYTSGGAYIGTYYMKNAYWNGTKMYYGDGDGTANNQPLTTLDICGHELGHAITQTTSGLVYQWESGALNEGFSDIWAACITNYAKTNYSLSTEITWRLAEKCWGLNNPNPPGPGLRDLSNPHLFNQPSTYNDSSWVPSNYQSCPVFDNNDNCGVHKNSGVLNKWFYLITQGETGVNSLGKSYGITGLGFDVTQKIVYLTSLNLPPNASYATAKTVSTNATATLYGEGSLAYQTVVNAWVAVGVDSNIYNMSNTPIFTTNNFTSIAVGTHGTVWAGTNYNGLYEYDGTSWTLRTEVPNVRINDIKADKAGGIWIAQSGTQSGGSSAIAGGVNYIPDPYTTSTFYTVSTQTHIPSRNARCMYIDTFRTNDVANNPRVWVATLNYINSGNSTSGMLGQGLYSAYKEFQPVSGGLNIASNTAGCLTVGGGKSTIWTFAQANNGVNQLLTYDAAVDTFIKAYDHTTVPLLPSGFVARAIYTDAKKRTWIGLANSGVMVYDEKNNWHSINFPTVFPSGSAVNFNAITGDKKGNVYIGTTSGIVFFDHGIGEIGRIDSSLYYKLYNQANGLPSNNINAIAYDSSRFKLLVATDSGIVFWEPLCLTGNCKLFSSSVSEESETISSGLWSNPAIWSTNKIPDSTTDVSITDSVTVDINGQCSSLSLQPSGYIKVNSGVNLTIYSPNSDIINGEQKQLSGNTKNN